METTTRERPILFSGEMVRAILEGRKTQTRRVVNPQPPEAFCSGDVAAITNGERWAISRSRLHPLGRAAWPADPEPGFLCPFGQPGDRLWVRETWQRHRRFGDDKVLGVIYKADTDHCGQCPLGGELVSHRDPWRSPIHMPRWASRITLEVTGVRIERVQDIVASELVAEGCPIIDEDRGFDRERKWFSALWDSLNAKRGFGWDTNPWVWVVEFKRVEPTQ